MSKSRGVLSWFDRKTSSLNKQSYVITPDGMNDLLYHYCSRYIHFQRDIRQVINFLQEHSKVMDLTYHKGQVFRVALSFDSTELLNVLLNFYTETKLQGPKDSDEYKEAYFQLQEALYQAMDRDNYSDGIKDILARYNIKIEDEPEIVEYDDRKAESSADNRRDNMSISDEDKFYDADIERRNGSDKFLLKGEGDVEETLLLTTPNLTAKQYTYCQVNREAEEYYAAHQYELCLRYIRGVAGAIARNPCTNVNVQEKSRILYNYLKFTAELGGGLVGGDKLLAKIWELTTDTYKKTILYAIKDNNRDVVELFLQKNPALVSIVDEYGQTPLHFAANNFECTKLLLDVATSEDIMHQAEGNHDYTAFDLATKYKNDDVGQLLASKMGIVSVDEIIERMNDVTIHKDDNSAATTYDRDSGSSDDLNLLGVASSEVS